MSEARQQAEREIAFCEVILAKGGLTVLSEIFEGVESVAAFEHFPQGDVYDPQNGAQWYYHCHPAAEGSDEHGHFHCFLRPQGGDGPIHHLIAIGVDRDGRPLRLFTVNQWVVDDDWADAAATVLLLERFDVQMPRPSYLVNRWLTAMVSKWQPQIAQLIHERDRVLAAHVAPDGVLTHQDRALEVTSELRIG